MIGALAIKRRRKRLQDQKDSQTQDDPTPLLIPIKSRHWTCIYFMAGISIITGVITIMAAFYFNTASGTYYVAIVLFSLGLLAFIVACCLGGSESTDSEDGDEPKEKSNGELMATSSCEGIRRKSIHSLNMSPSQSPKSSSSFNNKRLSQHQNPVFQSPYKYSLPSVPEEYPMTIITIDRDTHLTDNNETLFSRKIPHQCSVSSVEATVLEPAHDCTDGSQSSPLPIVET